MPRQLLSIKSQSDRIKQSPPAESTPLASSASSCPNLHHTSTPTATQVAGFVSGACKHAGAAVSMVLRSKGFSKPHHSSGFHPTADHRCKIFAAKLHPHREGNNGAHLLARHSEVISDCTIG